MTTPNTAKSAEKNKVCARQISEQNGAPEHILNVGTYFVQLRTPSKDVNDLVMLIVHAIIELQIDIFPPCRRWRNGRNTDITRSIVNTKVSKYRLVMTASWIEPSS